MSRFIYNLCESFVVQDLYNIFIVEQAGAFVAGRSDASTINLMIFDISTKEICTGHKDSIAN